ncbi:MAG TPA: signal peptide peptidase SppA [Syntrophales bacterium]|nr:signal peptide peptidase SppA [Syntrophales bacterium]
MRRHPILLAIIILIMMTMVFSALVFGISALTGKRKSLLPAELVAAIVVEGVITDGRETIEACEEAARDDSIRAVILRIDSPGGAVAPSQEIYEAVRELRKKKKVVASIGSVGASGGYLVACGAERIVANPGSITGSISTVMHLVNAQELMHKIGVKSSVIKSGKYKDIGSPAREMTPEERALLQGVIDDMNEHFLEIIVRERKMSGEKVKAIADGRIFSGRQAKQVGLVDELGDFNHAVQLAGKLAGMKEKPELVYTTKKKSFWEVLFQSGLSALRAEWQRQDTVPAGAYHLYE